MPVFSICLHFFCEYTRIRKLGVPEQWIGIFKNLIGFLEVHNRIYSFRAESIPEKGVRTEALHLIRIMPAEGIMKFRLYFFLFIVCSIILPSTAFAGGKTDTAEKTVVVYTYDSFASEWGPGAEIAKRFKEQTGYTVNYVICEDSGSVLSKAMAEKKNPRADVLLGINAFLVDKTRSAGVLEPYTSPNLDKVVPKHVIMTDDQLLTPYDWGYFAVMYDTQSKVPAPQSLEDLTKPEYAKSLVIMDPRTSAPGLGFAAWTKAVYGNDYLSFWKRLMLSILTMRTLSPLLISDPSAETARHSSPSTFT